MKYASWFFLLAIASFSCNKPNTTPEKVETKRTPVTEVEPTSALSIPLPDLQEEKTVYQIRGGRDTMLSYKTGSKIRIPKNAFLDKQGKPVKGPVTLTYREFSNPLEIYLAGIPMRYDSAGKEMVFESAGMFEMNANVQGEPVFPNPKSKIQVQMTSFQKSTAFNVYQLDTVTGKWDYLGKDKVEIENFEEEISELPPVPTPPVKAGQFAFTIGDDTGKFPELSAYEDVLFEPVNNEYCGARATEIQVKDLGNGMYDVLFILDGYGVHKETTCRCYLAFKEGAAYDDALNTYQEKYKTLLEEREKLKKEIEREWNSYRRALEKYKVAVLNREFRQLPGNMKVERTLSVSGFGFINCDLPIYYPQGAEVAAKFKSADGNDLILNNVVLVEKGRNALFRYKSAIKFNPTKDNVLWGITQDGQLAYFKSEDFKKINQTSGEYTFVMQVYSGKLTYETIREALF